MTAISYKDKIELIPKDFCDNCKNKEFKANLYWSNIEPPKLVATRWKCTRCGWSYLERFEEKELK